MRHLAVSLAVAAVVATALPSSAPAYCRGCKMEDTAAAAAVGAVIGTTIAKDGPRAFAPAPMPDAPMPSVSQTGSDTQASCATSYRRTWTAGEGVQRPAADPCQ